MSDLSFGSLMDIDKLILIFPCVPLTMGFGSLMDIDKLIPVLSSITLP